jgi:hypothetical protein
MNAKRIGLLAAIPAALIANMVLLHRENPVDAAWRIAGEHGYTPESHYLVSASYGFEVLGGGCSIEVRSRADLPAPDADPGSVADSVEPAHSPRGVRIHIARSSGLTSWRLTDLETFDSPNEPESDGAATTDAAQADD